jgi:hypothetical protein
MVVGRTKEPSVQRPGRPTRGAATGTIAEHDAPLAASGGGGPHPDGATTSPAPQQPGSSSSTLEALGTEVPTVELSDERARRLRVLNGVMALVHTAFATAMVVLGNDFAISISTLNLNGPPGTPIDKGTLVEVTSVRIAWATAAFSAISALFHAIVVTPPGFAAYRRELERGRNRFRWIEYSISASLMIVLIALITGITDLAALIAIAFVNAAMILFGWLMEVANRADRRPWWTSFWFGCIAGAAPWLAIVAYLVVNQSQAGAQAPPSFVYVILVTIFVLFNSFAVNQWLQYRRIGPWRDYLVGETTYVVLSLVAKGALAWQIFANTLVD